MTAMTPVGTKRLHALATLAAGGIRSRRFGPDLFRLSQAGDTVTFGIKARFGIAHRDPNSVARLLFDELSYNAHYETTMRRGQDILEKLDCLSEEEQQAFIQLIRRTTGFPVLQQVQQKILEHARSALHHAALMAGTSVLWSGFHPFCSVAYGLAFPGADLDAWTIILGEKNAESKPVGEFQKWLWARLTPRLVSIIGGFSCPIVLTPSQIVQTLEQHKQICATNPPELNMLDESWEALLETGYPAYNLALAKVLFRQYLNAGSEAERKQWLKLEKNINQVAPALELLREGSVDLLPNRVSGRLKAELAQSALYRFSNVLKIRPLKRLKNQDADLKPKLQLRRELFTPADALEGKTAFDLWPHEKQWELVKAMIYYSYDRNFYAERGQRSASRLDLLFDNIGAAYNVAGFHHATQLNPIERQEWKTMKP